MRKSEILNGERPGIIYIKHFKMRKSGKID